MKLDRNINDNGRGKYALLKLRKLDDYTEQGAFGEVAKPVADAIKTLERAGILDWGIAGTEAEFMVIRLKDKYAAEALEAYAAAAIEDDPEYAGEIRDMADRAGPNSPWCRSSGCLSPSHPRTADMDQIGKIRKLNEKRTKGPWRSRPKREIVSDASVCVLAEVAYNKDTAFIVALENAVPQILANADTIDRLTAVKRAAEAVCWFDWSGNDSDAVAAIQALRLSLSPRTIAG